MKEDKQRATPQATGKKRKKSTLSKLSDIFIQEDVGDVKKYVVEEVLIPGILEVTASTLNNAINMIFLGSTTPISTRSNISKYTNPSKSRITTSPRSRRNTYSGYNEVTGISKREAIDIMDELHQQLLDFDGMPVSVGDLYDAASIDTRSTDFDWGWESIDEFEIKPDMNEGGYYIHTPRPRPINSKR